MTTTLRVHFDGAVLVPEQAVDLPIGKSLEVHVADPSPREAEFGSPAQILRAVQAEPHLSSEDVAALNDAIAQS